jgi:error-prone DNA polymerase
VGQFKTVSDLARRAQLDPHNLQVLAATNALSTLASNRREALWQSVTTVPDKDMLSVAKVEDDAPELGAPSEAEDTDHEGALLGQRQLSWPAAKIVVADRPCCLTLSSYSSASASGGLLKACKSGIWRVVPALSPLAVA